MKKNIVLTSLFFFLFSVGGCRKSFQALLEKSNNEFQDKNYIEVVDTLNTGLSRWKESDGRDKKAQAYQLLGKSYHELRKMDKAIESYTEAVKLSEETYDSAYALGTYYLTSKEDQKALVSFRDALRMKKDDPMALVGLGNTYYDMGDEKNARLMFERVVEVSPGVKEAIEFLRLENKKISKTKTVVHSPKKPAPKESPKMKIQKSGKNTKKKH